MTGLLGAGGGMLLGHGLVRAQLALLDGLGLPIDRLRPHTPAWLLAVDVGTAVGVSMVGVFVASRRAARIRPLEVFRETGSAGRVMTVGRWIVGVLGLGSAIACAVYVQASGDLLAALALGLALIMAGSIGLQQLSPLVVPGLGALIGVLGRHPVTDVARAGLRDGVRRTATTAGSLIALTGIAVGLLGMVTTMVAGQDLARRQFVAGADLVVTTPAETMSAVGRVPGVDASSLVTLARVPVRVVGGAGSQLSSISVAIVDPATWTARVRVRASEGALGDLARANCVVSDEFLRIQGGRARALAFGADSPKQLPIVARTSSSLAGIADAYVTRDALPASILAGAEVTTLLSVAPGQSAGSVAAALGRAGFAGPSPSPNGRARCSGTRPGRTRTSSVPWPGSAPCSL